MQDTTNTPNAVRASRGAAALDMYTRTAAQCTPTTMEGAATVVSLAVEAHARIAGQRTLSEAAAICRTEAAQILSDTVTDVLHHMDGAEPADVLISAAWKLFGLYTGEYSGALAVQAEDEQTGDVIQFLASMSLTAVTFDQDPLSVLDRGLRDFEEEAESERVAKVRKARAERLKV
ncbi:hypothetical protein OHA27_37910 [Streptomyces sp. NBC_01619]|uniref:hypothetical protein n=1 Tax=Streptomyces sp. NBC_01619 TaxID=2975901 RepID=UPI00225460CD|nr:hypothetical protein [Streptomyces sp. NBC_01619]MCX4515897.1 hypothetical protein [Streptomyces sp. NBC_01619]